MPKPTNRRKFGSVLVKWAALKGSFGKGLHVKDMNHLGNIWYPKDIKNMLDKGTQDFATDYQSTNTIDGVSFNVYRISGGWVNLF